MVLGRTTQVDARTAPEHFGAPPHVSAMGPQIGGGELPLEPSTVCTAMACRRDDPCCNSCAFEGWKTYLGAKARSATKPLPVCKLDKCGRCPYRLWIRGRPKGDTYVVEDWVKQDPISTPSLEQVESALNTGGCGKASDCGLVALGHRLCGGPGTYRVYCKPSTDMNVIGPIIREYNQDSAAKTKALADQGIAGACVMARKPTISLVDGQCVGQGGD